MAIRLVPFLLAAPGPGPAASPWSSGENRGTAGFKKSNLPGAEGAGGHEPHPTRLNISPQDCTKTGTHLFCPSRFSQQKQNRASHLLCQWLRNHLFCSVSFNFGCRGSVVSCHIVRNVGYRGGPGFPSPSCGYRWL